MFIGPLLLKGLVASTGWEPRGGDKGVFGVELLDKSSTATLDVAIEHKNEADPDSAATTLASFTQMTTTGVGTKDATGGAKQLVRLKLTVDSSQETPDDWVIVDVLATSWRKN